MAFILYPERSNVSTASTVSHAKASLTAQTCGEKHGPEWSRRGTISYNLYWGMPRTSKVL